MRRRADAYRAARGWWSTPLVAPHSRFVAGADLCGQQAAWWWCVLCARSGHSRAALAAPALYAFAHGLARPGARWRVAALAASGVFAGLLGDTLLVRAELLSFSVPGAPLRWSPPFMVALWGMFALSFSASAAPLVRLAPGALSGFAALAGPLAYLGGERLSVLSLAAGAWVAVAAEWALLVSLLALWARQLMPTEPRAAL